jgi:hypothetical protein
MPFDLRYVEQLAEELGGLGKAQSKLREYGIPIWGDLYNHGAYKAIKAEPPRRNSGKTTHEFSTLAETDGLGAFKKICDRLELDIVLHMYSRTNWLTLRNAEGKRNMLKVYVSQWDGNSQGETAYTISGFRLPSAPEHYLCVSFESVRAWVITSSELRKLHANAARTKDKKTKKGLTSAVLPDGASTESGRLRVKFHPNDHFRFLNSRQVGL